MHHRKFVELRAARLSDGTRLTRAELPPPETRRWVASRKERVVVAVAIGLLTLEEALQRYDLSHEEFELWRSAVERHGAGGLKVTSIQKIRLP